MSEVKMRFRLVAGQHAVKIPGTKKHQIYNPGDIIESDVDLAKVFNQYSRDGSLFSYKYEKLSDGVSQPSPSQESSSQPSANLEEMDMRELNAYARERQIDLKGARTKEDVIRIIKMMSH